jgi:hypothetical protein
MLAVYLSIAAVVSRNPKRRSQHPMASAVPAATSQLIALNANKFKIGVVLCEKTPDAPLSIRGEKTVVGFRSSCPWFFQRLHINLLPSTDEGCVMRGSNGNKNPRTRWGCAENQKHRVIRTQWSINFAVCWRMKGASLL